jgi:predicted TIM-barrel fold metal-dependent hydrolase
MWRMDKEWKSAQREIPWVNEPPSEYVRRHVRVTTQPTDVPAEHLRDVYEQLGSTEVLMYGSDYPHLYPDGAEVFLSQLQPDERERVLWENAAACYGLELPAAARTDD